jgi:hypothetical protein
LRYVLPPSTMHYELNGSFANPKQSRNLVEGYNPRTIHRSNFYNLPLVQFRWPRLRSSLCVQPSLPHTITNVLCMRCDKKVRRVAARLIVTFVTTLKSIWNWAVSVHPCEPMRGIRLGFLSSYRSSCGVWCEPSVSISGLPAKPRPTLIIGSFLNPSPESYLWCGFGNHTGMELNN